MFLSRTAAEWEDELQAHHIPATRVRSLPESLKDHPIVFHLKERIAEQPKEKLPPLIFAVDETIGDRTCSA